MAISSGKKLLICGGTGLIGPYISKAFAENWDILVSSRTSDEASCDFTDPQQVSDLLKTFNPDAVIHLIALTSVEECEENPSLAHKVNVDTVENIVNCLNFETHFIYVSTDQVYPDQPGPHAENSADPINVYGKTKRQGEERAAQHSNSLTLRINLFGSSLTESRSSLSDFFIQSLAQNKPFQIFEDVFFSPLHLETLSSLVKQCVESKLVGLYNLGSCGGLSKADFARRIAQNMGFSMKGAVPTMSKTVPGRAMRPKDLRMDIRRIEQALQTQMPTLEEEIKKL